MTFAVISSVVCVPTGTSHCGQIRRPQSGQQDAQVVVDLRDRAHGGARRVAEVLLLDRDRGRQAVDVIDARLLHLADELPGIGAQALDVPPLSFGVDRVHGQRRLARTARPAEDRHLVAFDVRAHRLQVVLLSALHAQLRGHGGRTTLGTGDLREAARLRRAPFGEHFGQRLAGVGRRALRPPAPGVPAVTM